MAVWASIIVTLLNIAFTVLIAIFPPPQWAGLEAYLRDFRPEAQAPVIPALLLAPAILVLMTCIYYYSIQKNTEIFGRLAMVFSGPYVAMASVNYFIQITMVRQSILSGDTAGIQHFIMDNPHSIMVSIDTLGYMFLSIAALFASIVFTKTRLARAVSYLFVLTGILGLVGVFGFAINNGALRIGVLASGVPFLIATVLLAIFFYRLLKSGNYEPSPVRDIVQEPNAKI